MDQLVGLLSAFVSPNTGTDIGAVGCGSAPAAVGVSLSASKPSESKELAKQLPQNPVGPPQDLIDPRGVCAHQVIKEDAQHKVQRPQHISPTSLLVFAMG